MKTLAWMALTVALVPAWGQKLDLNFDNLAAKAHEKTEVDLDRSMIGLVLKNSGAKDLNGVLSGINGVVVRNYEFERAGAYSDADLQPLRKQVASGTGWSRIVNVKEDNETTEIYMFSQGDTPGGFLIISAEPKELTVVHVEGTVQLAQLQELVQSSVKFDLKNLPAGNKPAPAAQ
jgi:uncharacterized protein DUF4252